MHPDSERELCVIFGNAASVHTFNIAHALCLEEKAVIVVTLERCEEEDLLASYSALGIRLITATRHTEGGLRSAFRKVETAAERYIAVSATVYGQFLARLSVAKEQKSLVCLGTDIAFHMGREPAVAEALGAFHSVICPSVYLAEKVQTFASKDARLYVRSLGLRENWYKPNAEVQPAINFKNYFVTAKYFKWIYGFEQIIDYVYLHRQFLRDENVGFVFVGSGEKYRQKLLRKIADYGIGDRFKFVGFLSQSQLPCLIDNSAGGIYLSEYESFGVTLLETFARGKPVIYWDIPGYADATNGHQLGFPCRHGNFSHLHSAVLSCLRKEYASADFIAWADKFSWRKQSKGYVDALFSKARDDRSQLGKPAVFVSKFNMLELLSRRSLIKSAREKRTLEIFHALDRTTNVVPIFNQGPSALLEIRKINEEKVNFAYVEHGSNYSSIDQGIDQLLSSSNFPAVNFISDYHALSPAYLASVGGKTGRALAARERAVKRIQMATNGEKCFAAVPSRSVAETLKLPRQKVVELSPGFNFTAGEAFGDVAQVPKRCGDVTLVYAGGLGPFYCLARQLLLAIEAGCRQVFYVRKKEFDSQDDIIKELMLGEDTELYFDSSFDMNFVPGGRFCLGSLLMEPIPYIETAFPVKLVSYLSKGIPIIAYRNTVVGELIDNYQIGLTIDAAAEDFHDEVEMFLKHFNWAEFYRSRAKYIKDNTWEKKVEEIKNACSVSD